MPALPPAFLQRPIAHRALHGPGAPENSRAAMQRAIAGNYGIEIDLQLSGDGQAMVFHDYDLGRLTGARGPIQQRTAAELAALTLTGSDETVPTLTDILQLVAGRVPLLVEIKDQDGKMGPNIGALEAATAQALAAYTGPVAVMSFNPHSVVEMARLAPGIPRGLTTSAFTPDGWPALPAATRDHLRDIPDYDRAQASFISHEAADLTRPRVAQLRQNGAAILCWTVRSPEAEAEARKVAQNITFEGYDA